MGKPVVELGCVLAMRTFFPWEKVEMINLLQLTPLNTLFFFFFRFRRKRRQIRRGDKKKEKESTWEDMWVPLLLSWNEGVQCGATHGRRQR